MAATTFAGLSLTRFTHTAAFSCTDNSAATRHVQFRSALPPFKLRLERRQQLHRNFRAAQSEIFGGQVAREERRRLVRGFGVQLSDAHSFRPSRSDLLRKDAAAGAIVAMTSGVAAPPPATAQPGGLPAIPFKPDGYNYWTWRGHKIHYIEEGEGPPIVLVHGFGASAFHWRYNIPELAKKHKVFAIDLLGFGWSDKALVDYNAALWRDQVADFIRAKAGGQPVVLAGNSIGGFTVLSAAAKYPELVKGLVLLNVAGKFADKDEKAPVVSGSDITKELEDADVDDLASAEQQPEGMMEWLTAPVKQAAQRGMLMFAFYQARLPMRIKSVLQQVYIDKTNVDDYLVNSISQPAYGPNAAEVYYRLVTQVMLGPGATTVDRLLSRLKIPLLLLWGDLDPWMGPSKAARIQELYPRTDRVSLQSGHCPHDESPAEANKALLDWMAGLDGQIGVETLFGRM